MTAFGLKLRPGECVGRDFTADLPELRYRALVPGIGLTDARGSTPAIALQRARRRFLFRWLGVEWGGVAVPEAARDPWTGQASINGYRYGLWRHIGNTRVHEDTDQIACWIILNPSTADAANDATIRRVCDYSRRWGFRWVTVGNLWPFCSSKPPELRKWLRGDNDRVARAIERSDRFLTKMVGRAHLVVVAWGARGHGTGRDDEVLDLLTDLRVQPHALTLTKSGAPCRPLQLSVQLDRQLLHPLHAKRAPARKAG